MVDRTVDFTAKVYTDIETGNAQRVLDDLEKYANGIMDRIKRSADTTQRHWTNVQKNVAKMSDSQKEFATNLSNATKAVRLFLNQTTKVSTKLVDYVQEASKSVTIVTAYIAAVENIYKDFAQTISTLHTGIEDANKMLAKYGPETVSSLATTGQAMKALDGEITEHGKQILVLAAKYGELAQQLSASGEDASKKVTKGLAEGATGVQESVSTISSESEKLDNAVGAAIASVQEKLRELSPRGIVWKETSEAFGTVRKTVQQEFTAAVSDMAVALTRAGTSVGEQKDRINSALLGLIDIQADVVAKTQAQKEAYIGAWEEIVHRLITGSAVPDIAHGVRDWLVVHVEESLQESMAAIGRWSSAWLATGEDIQRGMQMAFGTRFLHAAGESVGQYVTAITSRLETLKAAFEQALDSAAHNTEGIQKVWELLVTNLIGKSPVPDLVEGIEESLVRDFSQVMGEHVKALTEGLDPDRIEEIRDIYTNIFKSMLDQGEPAMKLARSNMLDFFLDLDRYVVQWLQHQKEYLRAYRDLVAEIPLVPPTPFKDIAKEVYTGIEGEAPRELIVVMNEIERACDRAGLSLSDFADGVYTSATRMRKPIDNIGNVQPFNDMATAFENVMSAGGPLVEVFDKLQSASKKAVDAVYWGFTEKAYMAVSEFNLVLEDSVRFLKEGFVEGAKEFGDILLNSVVAVGDRVADQAKMIAGSVFDTLTFKGKEDKMQRSMDRAIALGRPEWGQKIRDNMSDAGIAVNTYEESLRNATKTMEMGFIESTKNLGVAVKNAASGALGFRESLGGLAIAGRQVARSLGLVSDTSDNIQKNYGRLMNRMDNFLSIPREGAKEVDKDLRRLAQRTDEIAIYQKEAYQTLTRTIQLRRAQLDKEMRSVTQLVSGFDTVRNRMAAILGQVEAGAAVPTEQLQNLGATMQEIFSRLPESLQNVVSKEAQQMAQFYNQWIQQAQQAGWRNEEIAQAFAEVFGGAINDVTGEYFRLNEEVKKMNSNYSKVLSMTNRAVEDMVVNSRHFITQLDDNGKIAIGRLQDMAHNARSLGHELGRMAEQKITGITPEIANMIERITGGTLLMGETFVESAQRSKVLTAEEEKLAKATKKAGDSVKGAADEAQKASGFFGRMLSSIKEHLPGFKKSTEEVEESVRKISDTTKRTTSEMGSIISRGISDIDSDLGDFGNAIGDTGRRFGDAMNGMKEIAESSASGIKKAFGIITVVAGAIAATLIALGISTGKLASEVRTLTITLDAVATNMGYNVERTHEVVEALRQQGITTREATKSMTSFIKARLPFEWSDPIQDATFNVVQLAEAAQSMAVTVGEDSSAMFARFIDFIETGNSQLLDAAGIAKTASIMQKEYADAIGKNVKSLTEYEKRMALVNGLMGEAAKVTGVYEEAMTSAYKQLGSMKRYIEEVRLAIGKHFEPVVAQAIITINNLLNTFLRLPESTKKTIINVITLATAVTSLTAGFGLLGPKIKGILMLLKPLMSIFGGKFLMIAALLTPLIMGLVDAFKDFGKEMGVTEFGMSGIMEVLKEIGRSIAEFIMPLVRQVMPFVRGIVKLLKDNLAPIVKHLMELLSGIVRKVVDFFTQNKTLGNVLEALKTQFGDLLAVVMRVAEFLLKALDAILTGDWEKAGMMIGHAFRLVITSIIQMLTDFLPKLLKWGWALIKSLVTGIWEGAKQLIPAVLKAIGSIFSGFLKGRSPPQKGPLSAIDEWGKSTLQAYIDGMGSVDLGGLNQTLNTIGNAIQQYQISFDAGAGDAGAAISGITGAAAGYNQAIIATINEILGQISDIDIGSLEELAGLSDDYRRALLAKTQEMIRQIQNEISRVDYQIGQIEEEMEKEVQRRLELAGLQIDPAVMEGLEKELKDANEEVAAAQRELERVRGRAGAFGDNILTWEEINAQAQLDAAEARRDEVQERIDAQKDLESQAEELRAQVEAEYQEQLKALEEYKESLQAQLQTLQQVVMEIGDVAPEPMADAMKDIKEEIGDVSEGLVDVVDSISNIGELLKSADTDLGEIELKVPTFSINFRQIFADIWDKLGFDADVGAVLRGIWEGFSERVKGIWEDFKETKIGKFLEEINVTELIETAFGGVGDVLGRIGESISGFISLFTGTGEAAGESLSGVAAWVRSVDWKKLFGDLFETLSDISRVLSGILALGFDVLTGIFTGDWSSIIEDLTKIGDAIADIFGWEDWDTMFEDIETWLDENINQPLTEFFTVKIPKFFREDVPKFFKGIWQGLIDAICWPFKELKRILVGNSIIPETIQAIVDWFLDLPNKLLNLAGDLLNAARDLGEKLWNGIEEWVGGIAEDVGEWFAGIGTSIAEKAEVVLEPVITLGTNIYNGIKDWIDGVVEDIGGWFENVGQGIADKALWIGEKAGEVGTSVYNAVKGWIDTAIENVGEWFGNIGTNIADTATNLYNNTVTAAKEIWQGFKDKFDSIITSVGTWLSDVAGGISSWATDLYNRAKALAQNVFQGLYDKFFGPEGIIQSVINWVHDIIDKLGLADVLTRWWTMGRTFFENLWSGIKSFFTNIGTGLKDFIFGLWNDYLKVGIENVINFFITAVNWIIDQVNKLIQWVPGVPEIPHLVPVTLPSLATGGVIAQDTLAQVHKGEVVLPLERFANILVGALRDYSRTVPTYAPTMVFQGELPSTIVPAVGQSLDLYTNYLTRG